MRLLLHICCGPCAAYPVKDLREKGIDITGYFFNPNIHPYKEFSRRLDTLKDYAQRKNLPLLIDDRYTLEAFLKNALSAPNGRCRMCYEVRLRKAAEIAKNNNFDAFSTTLLVSPYQKHDIIKEIAEQIAAEESKAFLFIIRIFVPAGRKGLPSVKKWSFTGSLIADVFSVKKKDTINQERGRVSSASI